MKAALAAFMLTSALVWIVLVGSFWLFWPEDVYGFLAVAWVGATFITFASIMIGGQND